MKVLKTLKNFFVDDTYAKVHALYLEKPNENLVADRKTCIFTGSELGYPWGNQEFLVYRKARVDLIAADMDKYNALVYGWDIYSVVREPGTKDGFVICVKSI